MRLTKYKTGSIRELWHISFPLMITIFSYVFMIFCDRLFLAKYSGSALNAAAKAGTIAWAFLSFGMILASIAEVFVAQYNGANKPGMLGQPVWQMIYLSLFSFILFIPLALIGSHWFFLHSTYQEMESIYFKWLLFFGPNLAIIAALSAFFIGRGKMRVVTVLAIVANIINIILDPVLIFGIEGLIPSMGIQGAAIATGCGQIVETMILAAIFLSRKNRHQFGTSKCKWSKPLFNKCIKVGLPQAAMLSIEVLGWGIFLLIMEKASFIHITVMGICHSIVILFLFFGEALEQGIIVIAGNLIGDNKKEQIYKVLQSGFWLNLIFCFIASFFFILFSEWLVKQFLNDAFINQSFNIPTLIPYIQKTLQIVLSLEFFCLFFLGLRWIITGVLVAAGDTLFPALLGSISIWIFLVAPTYYFTLIAQHGVITAEVISVLYGMILFSVLFRRYRQGNWKSIELIPDDVTMAKTIEE